jgi:4-hydroxyacetophenone monooxygenase
VRRALEQHIRSQYTDRPDLAERVVPDYPPGAKRMLRDNGVWARALKQPHVELVTEPIAELTAKGIRTADGVERAVDVIVWGTGFTASDFLTSMTVRGRGGVDLHEQWAGDARAYLGSRSRTSRICSACTAPTPISS